MIIMYITNKIYYDGDTSQSIAQELIDNFNGKYYRKFLFGKNNLYSSNLLDESNNIPIRFGEWPGTVEGCGKEDESAYVRIEEKCQKDEVFLKQIPHKYIEKYNGITFDVVESDKTYSQLFEEGLIIQPDLNKKKNEQCPKDKKNCGYIDTVNNILCLPIEEECPINYISIRKKGQPLPDIKNINKIEGKDKILYYSSDPYPDSEYYPKIFSNFKIADRKICAAPNLYYSSIPLFILDVLNKNYSQNCQLLDYSLKVIEDHKIRYTEIDQINNYDLYEENGIIDKINNSLLIKYGYKIDQYKDINVYLYYRPFIGFKKECLDKRKMKPKLEELISTYATADKMISWGNRLYWLWFNSIGSLLDLIDFFPSGCLELIEKIIKFAANIVSSGIFFILDFKAVKFDDPFEEKMACSDDVTNSNYNIMIEKIQKSGGNIKITSILIFVLFIVNIASLVIRFLIHRERKKSQNNGSN